MTPGEIVYNAYCESRNWKAFNGDPLPTYESMKTDPKRADLVPSWEAGATALILHLGSEVGIHEASHASAPKDHKCSDCTIDGHPCPLCYSAWWKIQHPDVHQH